MNKIRPKNKEFAQEYVKNGNNATNAVKKVFKMKDDNHSAVKGSILLRNTKVQKEIKSIADSIPNELLIEKHLALLNKQEVVTKNNMTTGEVDVIQTGEVDGQAVKAGLDMAYKLKKLYEPGNTTNIQNIIVMPQELIHKNATTLSTK